jgi:hypothetical protein
LAEEVVEDLERMIIPFHATYSAIRNGENIGTILLDAGLDALIFLPAIGAGISLSARTGLLAAEIMLEEMEGLSEKGLLQAMKQGSARLAALSPEWVGEGSKVLTLAAENALWLPQDILSLLRGTRRWTAWGMRSLLQSLEKTNPNLAQKLSQAFTKAASRLGEDGKSWRLSEDLLKAPPKINPAVTLSESKIATAEASIKVLPTPYVKASTADGASQILQRVDENNYLEVNPQTLAPEGSLLVADAQGSLRPLLLTDAVEKFKVQDQTVITQLTAQSEPEDHVYRLGNKCYAKISDQFVEIVPNSRATLFWRINDPILFGSASADYVMPSMIWDNESQQWQQMAAPRLLGGGNFSSRFGNKPEFETGSSGFEKVPDNVIERIAAFYEEDEGTILSLSLVNKRFHRLLEPHRDYLELSKEIKNLHHDNISYFFPSLSFLINFKKITARIGEKFRGIQREKLLVKLSEKIPIRTEHGFFHPVTYITFSGGYIRDWLRAVAQWRQSPKSLNYKEWVRLENRVKACQYFVDNPDAMWGIQEVLPFTTPGFKVTHGWFISIAKSKDGFETLKVLSENVDALLLMLSGDDRSQRMVDRVLEIARDGGSDDLQALFTRYRAAKNL